MFFLQLCEANKKPSLPSRVRRHHSDLATKNDGKPLMGTFCAGNLLQCIEGRQVVTGDAQRIVEAPLCIAHRIRIAPVQRTGLIPSIRLSRCAQVVGFAGRIALLRGPGFLQLTKSLIQIRKVARGLGGGCFRTACIGGNALENGDCALGFAQGFQRDAPAKKSQMWRFFIASRIEFFVGFVDLGPIASTPSAVAKAKQCPFSKRGLRAGFFEHLETEPQGRSTTLWVVCAKPAFCRFNKGFCPIGGWARKACSFFEYVRSCRNVAKRVEDFRLELQSRALGRVGDVLAG